MKKNHNKEIKRGHILFDYDAQEEDEVSIRSGEVFHLVCAYEDGWWLVTVHGEQGMIPSNYAQLEEQDDDDDDEGVTTTATTTTQETNREAPLPPLEGEGEGQEESPTSNIKSKICSSSPVILSNRSSRPSLEIEEDAIAEESPRLGLPLDDDHDDDHDVSSPRQAADDATTRPSSALERLMVLREETTAKIDKLRSTVSRNEEVDGEMKISSANQKKRNNPHKTTTTTIRSQQQDHLSDREEGGESTNTSPSLPLRKNKSELTLTLKPDDHHHHHHQNQNHSNHSNNNIMMKHLGVHSVKSSRELTTSSEQSTEMVVTDNNNNNNNNNNNSSSSGNSNGSRQSIPQVTLDPSSIDYISKIIHDKIVKEINSRDKKILDKVKEFVDQSMSRYSPQGQQQPQPSYPPRYSKSGDDGRSSYTEEDSSDSAVMMMIQQPNSNKPHHSADGVRRPPAGAAAGGNSKIPRIRLPKIGSAINSGVGGGGGVQESNSARSMNSKIKIGGGLASNPHSNVSSVVSLPPLNNKQKLTNNNNSNNNSNNDQLLPRKGGKNIESQISISEEGIQYPQCRSVVYPSSSDLDIIRQKSQQQQQQQVVVSPHLVLGHILGYDGDPNRHGNISKGKNVVFISDIHIAYPAAAVVIICDLTTSKQSFFMGHNDDVISLIDHPFQACIASAQIGQESNSILIWDYSPLLQGQQRELSDANITLSIPSNTRGMVNLSFSGDGEFLLACSVEDTKMVYIFDWKKEILLLSVKTGHVDVNKFVFNPYSFSPFQDEEKTNEMKYASGIKVQDAPLLLPGCYTLISYGGKQVKFWTLKQEIQYSPGSNISSDNNLQQPPPARDYRGKKFRSNALKFSLEGGLGGNLKQQSDGNSLEYTCCAFLKGDKASSTILLGSRSGSIYVWEQVEEDRLESGVEDGHHGSQSWVARGKLVMVIAEAHDGPIMEMDIYRPNSLNGNRRNQPSLPTGMLISSDSTGTINLWSTQYRGNSKKTPLEHRGGIRLEESYGRSLCFNDTGDSIIIGTANNAVLLLSLLTSSSSSSSSSDEKLSLDLNKITVSHNGKVRKIAINPVVSNMFASICTDKTIRLWDGGLAKHLSTIEVDFVPTAISFSSDGQQLAIGSDVGMLTIVGGDSFSRVVDLILSGRAVEECLDDFAAINWEVVESKLVVNSSGNAKKLIKKGEINEIRYSPNGDLIAVGCKDNLIHLISNSSGYRQLGACRGHSSQIRCVDFSIDGSMLRSCDASKELLFWDIESCQRITQPTLFRNQQWYSNSCIYGWGLQGIFNRWNGDKSLPPDGEINCVTRSPDGSIVIAAGSNINRSAIKAFDYPVLMSAQPTQYGGHSSPVLDVSFIQTVHGVRLISAGGNDSCIFIWDVDNS